MTDRFTNAAEMARNARVDGKAFRAQLRKLLPHFHEVGSWKVVIGGEKHQAMTRVLAELQRQHRI